MINREMIKAILLSYEDNPDEYGQVKQNTPNKRTIEITKPRLYKHTNVEDIRFNEVEDSSLTFEKTITDADKLLIGDDTYSICFVNPEGRLTQLFLKKDK